METGETVLVTGATGRTGRAVIAALAERGARVRAMTRSRAGEDGLHAAGAHEIALADLGDRSSLEDALSGIARLYHIG
ncbi:MAG: NAD-dependent epimerase/dehydratase family protein, partial [Mesorhizobium sp.]